METAVITSVRNDKMFLRKWIDYYGGQFGKQNLFVFMDGRDQVLPDNADGITVIWLPRRPLERVPAMRRRARAISDLGRALHRFMDCVIATDVDEFLVPDPARYGSLRDYLEQAPPGSATVSGLGLDVGQHLRLETDIDLDQPFLGQRRFAHLSARYTKPAISFRPVTWGSGMHRVKGRNFRIDPDLFLFHFGMVDFARSTGKTADIDRLATGWGGHLERRERLFKIILDTPAVLGDQCFPSAIRWQSWVRPPFALNKPAMMWKDLVAEIPHRFFGII